MPSVPVIADKGVSLYLLKIFSPSESKPWGMSGAAFADSVEMAPDKQIAAKPKTTLPRSVSAFFIMLSPVLLRIFYNPAALKLDRMHPALPH